MKSININNNYHLDYLVNSPSALALERILECEIFSTQNIEHPILDLGCGDGIFAHILFKDKLDVGIDPDLSELKRASSYGIYLELLECYGDKIPKNESTFQTIISNSVLEHIKDIRPVLNEIHRVLKPGGHFYMTVPSEYFDKYSFVSLLLDFLGLQFLAKKYQKFYNNFWRHYHYYSIEEWKNIVLKSGFKINNSFSYGSKLTCVINDLLVPFGIVSMVSKKNFGKWVLFPNLRKMYIFPFYLISKLFLKNAIKIDKGGLVFLDLTKVIDS